MKVWLAGSFLPLLLLASLPIGVSQQISATIDASLRLDLVLQCLLQAGSGSTAEKAKWFNTTQNDGEKLNEDVKKSSAQLVLTGVNATHVGTYTCRMKNVRSVPSSEDETVSWPGQSVLTVECSFRIWLENITVHVEWYKTACLKVVNQTNTTALGENCSNLTSPCVHAADIIVCGYRVLITRINLTDTGNGTQGTGPNYGAGEPQTNITEKDIWTGLNFLLCILFGLAVGTLLYMPIIAFLLWHCRRNRKGKLTSSQETEGNQLSTAAQVTGTEDLTYANLKFEKKGTKPTTSDVVYTEIKPSQQKQSDGNACAANTEVDVCPEEERK